jgi:hypothetical protein
LGTRYDIEKTSIDTQKSGREFAKFLQEDAPEQHKNLRGMLIETEMQAQKLRCLAQDVAAENTVPGPFYQPDPLRRGAASHAVYEADAGRPIFPLAPKPTW